MVQTHPCHVADIAMQGPSAIEEGKIVPFQDAIRTTSMREGSIGYNATVRR